MENCKCPAFLSLGTICATMEITRFQQLQSPITNHMASTSLSAQREDLPMDKCLLTYLVTVSFGLQNIFCIKIRLLYSLISLLHLGYVGTICFGLQNIFCIKIRLLYFVLSLLHLAYMITVPFGM